MSTLTDDLKKSVILRGEELDKHLYAMKDKYTSEEDKKIITDFMLSILNDISKEVENISNRISTLEALKAKQKNLN